MAADRLQGVLPVFQTPFNEDLSVDFKALESHLNWLFDRGADGLVMAMVSETLRLDCDEREQVSQLACQVSRGRGPVVISVGAESTHTTLRFARAAQKHGADAVMAIPPVSVACGEEELATYYRAILKAIDIPVIVQDASGYVGRPMSIAMQAQMFKEFGQRVLYKPEANPIGPRLTALHEATGFKARVFEGSGGFALADAYRRGIAGTMPGGDLIDAQVALWRALQAGDDDRIYQLYEPLCSLVSLCVGLDGYLAIEKHLLVRQGIFKNTLSRGPVGFTLDKITREEVDRRFDRLMAAVATQAAV